MKKAKKLHQTVLTELGDIRILEDKKEKAEALLCLFKYECYKDKLFLLFLLNKENCS